MPTRLWKCKHCSFTSKDYNVVAKHEKECTFEEEVESIMYKKICVICGKQFATNSPSFSTCGECYG